jgi:hypothetical protein
VPFFLLRGRFLDGDEIPVEGARFPELIAPVIELQGAAVLDALVRIERSDGTP